MRTGYFFALSCCYLNCVFFPLSAESHSAETAYRTLDDLAIEAGTDKSSLFHNYTKIYAKYFDAIHLDNIKLLEIGIYYGDSVKMWESYFINGDLHFVDINSDNIRYHSTRSHYHFVDQADIIKMRRLGRVWGDFDIIIDDGGHTMAQQINSFIALFPSLKDGGMYIFEDLHTSYWSSYGGGGRIGAPAKAKGTCVEFLKELVDDINYTAGVTACADSNKISPELRSTLSIYQDKIDSIHFYQSFCIILKK